MELSHGDSWLQWWCRDRLVGVVAWDPEEHGTSGFYLCRLTSASEHPAILLGQQV